MESTPRYWGFLTSSDQAAIQKLRLDMKQKRMNSFSTAKTTTMSSSSNYINNIKKNLNDIRIFCSQSDGDDWKRFLACGVCFFSNGIAINFSQLSQLTGCCKASIKNALVQMNYTGIPKRADIYTSLKRKIPYLKDKPKELREWTIKRQVIGTPAPSIQMLPALFYDNVNNNSIAETLDALSDDEGVMEPSQPTEECKTCDEVDLMNFFNDPFCLPPVFLLDDTSIEVNSV